jgi:hypothetical protein
VERLPEAQFQAVCELPSGGGAAVVQVEKTGFAESRAIENLLKSLRVFIRCATSNGPGLRFSTASALPIGGRRSGVIQESAVMIDHLFTV